MSKKELGEALQQMTGFKIGKWSDIIELVTSMGLKKEEWEYIKREEESGHLDDDDIEKINGYFANCEVEE